MKPARTPPGCAELSGLLGPNGPIPLLGNVTFACLPLNPTPGQLLFVLLAALENPDGPNVEDLRVPEQEPETIPSEVQPRNHQPPLMFTSCGHASIGAIPIASQIVEEIGCLTDRHDIRCSISRGGK